MDSMEIKSIKWKKTTKIPNTPWNIKGYSRSAYRTGFYIPELNIMLDAGCQNFNKPNHIFITHTHLDHIAELPFTMIGDPEGNHIFNIYAPANAKDYIYDYICSAIRLNSLDIIDIFDWYKFNMCKQGNQYKITSNKTNLQIDLFKCNHRIPTVGYGFSIIKDKLKEEYLGLSGKEIVELKKHNVITRKVIEPKFVYLCDTDIDVFKINKLETILSYPTIFIECTFILPDEIDNASSTKHIHWEQLRPYVLNNKNNMFILFHFSQRYSDAEIEEFFAGEKEKYNFDNIRIL